MTVELDMSVRKLLTSSCKELGVSYPTMRKYIETGEFPGEICINIERLTNGRITYNELRPDLFDGLPADIQLGKVCIDQFESAIECQNYQLVIGILNYLEVRQPTLYKEMIEEIKLLDGGKLFIAQRLAHRHNGHN